MRRPKARGVVSVVALVTVVACAVAAASVAAWSGAQSEVADARGRRAVGMSLALSGVEGVVAEIAKQRAELLRGASLNLTGHTVVWTAPDAGGVPVNGVVRLMPLGRDGVLAQTEGSKLDVNEVSEERLKNLGSLSAEVLSKVVSGRASRAWGSVWEIVALAPGSGHETPRAMTPIVPKSNAGTTEGAEAAPGATAEEPGETREVIQPADALTCYSADPQVRSGFTIAGAVDPDATGRARFTLPEKWSPEVEKQVAAEITEQWATWLRGQYGANKRPTSASMLAANAAGERVEPVVVAGMLDALEFDDGGTRRGMVDLLTASAEALGGVPGIPQALADRIVAARGKLESSRRATALWPVLEGLVELAEFAPALDHVTSRCLVFRVMVEGGTVGGEMRGEPESWALGDRWAYEAIVDASEVPVRIAYLRAAAFDQLVIPGAKEPEVVGAATSPAESDGTASAAEADEAVPASAEDGAPGADDDESSAAPVAPARPGREGAGVDSPAAPSASPTSAARSRIGRWNGGGGGAGAASSGGTPK